MEVGSGDLGQGAPTLRRLDVGKLDDGAFNQPSCLFVKRLRVSAVNVLEKGRVESGIAVRMERGLDRSVEPRVLGDGTLGREEPG
jgi:hypothetical protein